MSTPTTTQQDNLQSRLPDPSQFIRPGNDLQLVTATRLSREIPGYAW